MSHRRLLVWRHGRAVRRGPALQRWNVRVRRHQLRWRVLRERHRLHGVARLSDVPRGAQRLLVVRPDPLEPVRPDERRVRVRLDGSALCRGSTVRGLGGFGHLPVHGQLVPDGVLCGQPVPGRVEQRLWGRRRRVLGLRFGSAVRHRHRRVRV
jgi:hypothetical protein